MWSSRGWRPGSTFSRGKASSWAFGIHGTHCVALKAGGAEHPEPRVHLSQSRCSDLFKPPNMGGVNLLLEQTCTFVVAVNERSDGLVFSFWNVLEPLH